LEVDARSDLYSLGVTFYEMLAGRLPFPHTDTNSEYEIMRSHIELVPPPLAEAAPGIPPGLADIVMQSLEKDPNARFQPAAPFLQALIPYEPRGVTAPQSIRAPQGTNSMTELLPVPTYETNPATENTRSRPSQLPEDRPPTNIALAPPAQASAPVRAA